jgi:NADPH:quinone reductase-like Zn-dependent oxidoreductase
MPKAVRYNEFGGIGVLRVEAVERPAPGDGQVLVRVKAAGINPSEAVIRTGAVADLFPSTFPSGQGSDLAGVIEEVGAGVGGFSPGDEVIGFTNKRGSQAELALVEAGDLTRKPEKVSWEAAGGLYVAGATAWWAAGLIADGHLEVPIAILYPLAQVREACNKLERRHTCGKIVLRP